MLIQENTFSLLYVQMGFVFSLFVFPFLLPPLIVKYIQWLTASCQVVKWEPGGKLSSTDSSLGISIYIVILFYLYNTFACEDFISGFLGKKTKVQWDKKTCPKNMEFKFEFLPPFLL